MRFTFPYSKVSPKAEQPDYEKWQAVSIGMTREEVTELLGKPRQDGFLAQNSPYHSYGYLQLPFCLNPALYSFLIGIDESDIVFHKSDPFQGNFSHDGSPTTPNLIIPQEDQVFSHFPRIVDVRWQPVSGVYPMTYTVECGGFPWPDLDGAPPEYTWRDEVVDSDLSSPFFMFHATACGPNRIRVKAHNEIGESEWSEYRTFRFTV